MALSEAQPDREYLGSLADRPELEIVDRFWFLMPAVTVYSLWKFCGVHCAVPLTAMYSNMLLTLLFNVEYHRPEIEDKKSACKALDNVKFLSELVGESYHHDHHKHPSRAKRPGMDLVFYMFLKPLLLTTLAWSPKDCFYGHKKENSD